MYHTYTVDVHSIFLVEELRRLWQGKYEQAVPELTELMRGCDDRAALFLGCLLHDIGKGFGGNHSEKGAERARRCVERLGLAPERVERVIFLVQHHLLISPRAGRDLSDADRGFARVTRDRRSCDLYLYLAASRLLEKAWTDWKACCEASSSGPRVPGDGLRDPTRAGLINERRCGGARQPQAAGARRRGIKCAASRDDAAALLHRARRARSRVTGWLICHGGA
jgi:[protein-PII] uridylyltransferase